MYNDNSTHDGFDDAEDMSAEYDEIAGGNNIIPFPPTLVRVNDWALHPFSGGVQVKTYALWLLITLLVAALWGKHVHAFLGDL